jgi:hypothetical protein
LLNVITLLVDECPEACLWFDKKQHHRVYSRVESYVVEGEDQDEESESECPLEVAIQRERQANVIEFILEASYQGCCHGFV